MYPLKVYTLKEDVVYREDMNSIPYSTFKQNNFVLGGEVYTPQDDLLDIKHQKIFKIFQKNEFGTDENLLAIEPKLAELLDVISHEELFKEAKQEMYEDLKDKIKVLERGSSERAKREEHFIGELVKLEDATFWARLNWVFTGLPVINLLGYLKNK